ncbi:MAG TPA: hypothetical protein VKU41_30095 [Polyangiaceae bacterium]|nr:hypothetical protein [Polyangiaceae bacterium]
MGVGFVVMVAVLLPRFARAHTLGLSTADFVVGPEGTVDAAFDFARGEPLGPAADLASFLIDGVVVTADGTACPGTFGAAEPDAVDGLRLTSSFACPAGSGQIEVTLYYLSALPRGHRQVARIVAGSASAEAILSSDRRALSLRIPDATPPLRRRGGLVRAGVAALAIGLVAWCARRVRQWRRERHAGQAGHRGRGRAGAGDQQRHRRRDHPRGPLRRRGRRHPRGLLAPDGR